MLGAGVSVGEDGATVDIVGLEKVTIDFTDSWVLLLFMYK